MGAYSPAPIVDEKLHQKIIEEVMKPTMQGLIAEGSPYLGFLYAGLMINNGELKVLEFNCRFGDPETQPILLRLKSSLVELCLSAIDDQLNDYQIQWTDEHACGVVIASHGYPQNYTKDNEVKIMMTLTSPNCPVAESLPQEVEEKIKSIDEVKTAEVEITFDPPWTKDLMSEEAKLELGFL